MRKSSTFTGDGHEIRTDAAPSRMVTFPTITPGQISSRTMKLPRYKCSRRKLGSTLKTPGKLPPHGYFKAPMSFKNLSVRKDSDASFAILVASADKKPTEKHAGAFDKVDIAIEYGDYSEALQKVNAALSEAKKYAGAPYLSCNLKFSVGLMSPLRQQMNTKLK